MGKLKSTALNGCWKKLWPEAVSDFRGFPDQQDEIRSNLMVTHKLREKDFHMRRLIHRKFLTLVH
jgi:hypothetical protein